MATIKRTEYLTTGRLVEAIMLYRGLNCQQLAQKIGEHPMNFYKILNGSRNITTEMSIKLSNALNMSPLIIMESRNIEIIKS